MIRIAMIGGGPKSLFALLELNDVLDAEEAQRVRVDVYDPYPPGAGRVWNTSQPKELRLNVNSRIIDASFSENDQTFDQFKAGQAVEGIHDVFASRAVVGQYLNQQFELLAKNGRLQVSHRPAGVQKVERDSRQWTVSTSSSAENYDEIVLATGHGLTGYDRDRMQGSTLAAAQLTVEQTDDAVRQVPAGSEVLIRGAALTAYDVIMALTEGRGGRWVPGSDDSVGSLAYLSSGEEPALLTMTSRLGIPMSPKPRDVGTELNGVLNSYRARVRAWGEAAIPGTDVLWRILVECAKAVADLNGVTATRDSLRDTILAGRSAQFIECDSPFEQLRFSLEANRGDKPKTHEWVWAVTWSKLYAEIVEALSRYNWSEAERDEFTVAAANLERMAFGPPEPIAEKLLALHDAGLLGHERADASFESNQEVPGQVMIDAVSIAPGVLTAPAPQGNPADTLFSMLLESGEIMVRNGERGLFTDTDGTCFDARGERNESLTALGRPSEDPTLGHDTLNRTLHTEYRKWARRITAQAAAKSQKAAH
ncbi:hypothetical protein AQ436_16500 [Arthrobacter sp. EpRS66]|nr:hypothetical protein AQ436_16500 [Arthrobacter sp. EpRS66]